MSTIEMMSFAQDKEFIHEEDKYMEMRDQILNGYVFKCIYGIKNRENSKMAAGGRKQKACLL
jgi:hypothetical protein